MFPRAWLACVLLSVLFITTAVADAHTAPNIQLSPMQLVPTVSVSAMSPSSQNANVTAITGAAVAYSAKVTVTKPPLVTVTVKLTSRCSASFPTTVSPDSITFTQPGSVPISITVVIPAKARMANGIVVTVDAKATYTGGSVTSSAQGVLNVLQYHDVKATVDTIIGKGNPQEFQVHIQNLGNGNDTFVLEIPNKADLDNSGIRLEFSQTEVTNLAPDGNATVKLKVSYGLSTPSGKKEINVKISSINATQDKAGTTQVTVNLDVGTLGGGGSETYIVVGLTVLLIFVAILLFWMYNKKLKGKPVKGRTIKLTEEPKAPSDQKKEKATKEDTEDEEEAASDEKKK